jgi:hypothetical protein
VPYLIIQAVLNQRSTGVGPRHHRCYYGRIINRRAKARWGRPSGQDYVEKVPGTANTGRTKVSEKPHPGRLGCGFLFRRRKQFRARHESAERLRSSWPSWDGWPSPQMRKDECGCGPSVNFVPGTKLICTLRHRQSGAPLLVGLKESGSGDGTGGRRPDGGAHQARIMWKRLLEP